MLVFPMAIFQFNSSTKKKLKDSSFKFKGSSLKF